MAALDFVRGADISLVGLFLLATGTLYILVTVGKAVFDPLRDVPGPFAARFTRLWEVVALHRSTMIHTHIDLHKKYGPIVRLAPDRYSIGDSDAFKTIYGHGSIFKKSDFYHAFGDPAPNGGDMFSERDNKQHALKRRKVAQLYSVTTLLSYEQFVDKCNAVLCDKLRKFATQGRTLDVFQWMQFYAFDVIGEISVGEPFGLMRDETDTRGILNAIHEAMMYGANIGLMPEFHPILAGITSTLGVRIPFDTILDFIQEQISARVEKRKSGSKDDFLDKLLTLEANGKITRRDVITTLGANIAAGSDTTALSLTSVIYFLLKHPDVTKKLRQEIDHFTSTDAISDPPTFKEGQNMPYLQAVIKEALRCHPATGQIMARVVPPEGAEIAGRFFPGNTVVGCNPWITHLNKEIYGEDADQFNPERWLGDKTTTTAMETNLFSFGAGARTCVGKNISLLEMTKVIPQLYKNFDFELQNPSDEWELNSGWFVKQKFFCTVKARKQS